MNVGDRVVTRIPVNMASGLRGSRRFPKGSAGTVTAVYGVGQTCDVRLDADPYKGSALLYRDEITPEPTYRMMPSPAGTREERKVTPETLTAIDDWIDADGVFSKPYWTGHGEAGKLQIVGLRIGDYPNHLIARFDDTIVRQSKGVFTVVSAADMAELNRLRLAVQSAAHALTEEN